MLSRSLGGGSLYGLVSEARYGRNTRTESQRGSEVVFKLEAPERAGKRVFDGSLSKVVRMRDGGYGERGRGWGRDRLHAAFCTSKKVFILEQGRNPMNLVVVSNRHSCEKNSRSGRPGQGGTARAGAGLTFRAGQGTHSCGPGQGWVRTEIKSWDRGPFWQVGVWWDGAPHLGWPGPLCCWRDAETVRECERADECGCVRVRGCGPG